MSTNEKPPDDPGGTPEDVNIITDEKLEEAVCNTVTGEKSLGSEAEATMTSPWGVDGQKCKNRSYEQIVEESKKEIENVLCIRIEKLRNVDNSNESGQKISYQDIENIIFDEINVEVDQIEEIDFSKFNTKEIYFKSGHDVKKYCRNPFVFKGHMISVGNNVYTNIHTKVTFLNVPKYVPDEELIHFCSTLGVVKDPTVYYGKHQGGRLSGLKNGSRWIEAEIIPSRRIINFIWLEGPRGCDTSSRITVTYGSGRERQCGHCLRTSQEGCPGQGKAKICREKNGERASANDYMKKLEEIHGYKTLKSSYVESLSNEKTDNETGDELNDEQSASTDVKTMNDSEKVEIRSETQEINQLKRDIITLKAEMKARSDKIEKNDEKMKIIRTNILKHLKQSLSDPLFESSSMSLLVTQLSSTLTDDEYEIGECGLARLKSEAVFTGLILNYDTAEEAEVAKVNFVAFGKAVESRLHSKMIPSSDRRLSFGGRTSSPKRKSSDDGKTGNENKKPLSRLPAPPPAGKGKSSPKVKDKRMTLQQFHTKNSE